MRPNYTIKARIHLLAETDVGKQKNGIPKKIMHFGFMVKIHGAFRDVRVFLDGNGIAPGGHSIVTVRFLYPELVFDIYPDQVLEIYTPQLIGSLHILSVNIPNDKDIIIEEFYEHFQQDGFLGKLVENQFDKILEPQFIFTLKRIEEYKKERENISTQIVSDLWKAFRIIYLESIHFSDYDLIQFRQNIYDSYTKILS